MTKQEFYEKYGSVKVKFTDYYKYTFTYAADLTDGRRLTCGYGGNSDKIYRHELSADGEVTISSLKPYEGMVYENGKATEIFYAY